MENSNNSLAQKNVIITGGTTGIGKATALLLASQRANLIILGRNSQKLNTAVEEIKSLNGSGKVIGIEADVSREEDIQKIFDTCDSEFASLDILMNNAAISYQSIMDGTYKDWKYAINTNICGYLACAQEAIQRMKPHKSGHIINIGSMSADTREKNSSVYVATKAAIQGFNEALRKEVNPLGIKVSLIEPGAVATDMQPLTEEEMKEKIEKLEMLNADDIAKAVVFCLTQPERCDIVNMQIRPHLQII